jgi:hypothetical protein
MDLDILDETYPMGKSNLPFKDFGQGGLTGVEGGLTGLAQTCHSLVSTKIFAVVATTLQMLVKMVPKYLHITTSDECDTKVVEKALAPPPDCTTQKLSPLKNMRTMCVVRGPVDGRFLV